jgi:D-glycero-D-manno-heptose 1,7-bisphosphate phosphatase
MKRAVFLDRDGTIIEDKDFLSDPDRVVIFPGAPQALKRLANAGFKLFIVSNQSGVGRGYFTMNDVNRVNDRLVELLALDGVGLEKIYVAPEAPEQPSRGRKPSPQFLFDARDEFDIELSQSYMVGDKLTDLECGWNAGVKKCILVRTGYGAKLELSDVEQISRANVVNSLAEVADCILAAKEPGT